MGHDIKTAAETETPTLMMTPISNYTTDNKNALKQNLLKWSAAAIINFCKN